MSDMWAEKAKSVITDLKSKKLRPVKLATKPKAFADGGEAGDDTHFWNALANWAYNSHREGRAEGGEVGQIPLEQIENDAQQRAQQAKRPRFRIASSGAGAASPEDMGNYQFQKLEEGKANTNSLKMAFDRAIQRHTSLPESQRIANSKAAIKALEPYLGKGKSGPISLFTKNGKMMKAEQGTGDSEPLMLDDGRGVETMGLNLYPDYREGEFKMCPNSASCRGACLGKTSGQNKEEYKEAYARAKKVHPQDRALNRTKAMLRDPEAFAVRLWDEIESMRRQAELRGNHLGVRLNGLSDMNPIIHKSLIESQPLVSFYDYTKMKWRPVAENHHYTYSSTGTSNQDVDNPHQNWNRMRNHLEQGDNVAMAFSHKAGVPKFVHDEETGKRYTVVSGDEHDFRPMDIQPEGKTGVIVGLKNKDNSKGSDQKMAHIRSKGFFVKYDPKTDGDTAFIPKQEKKAN